LGFLLLLCCLHDNIRFWTADVLAVASVTSIESPSIKLQGVSK
jgi:hypothetical protein